MATKTTMAGAITAVYSQVIVRRSVFQSNTGGNGGAIDLHVSGSTSILCYLQTSEGTNFRNNTALKGGAVHVVSPCYTNIDETRFSFNKATLPESPKHSEAYGIGAAIYIETPNFKASGKYANKANMQKKEVEDIYEICTRYARGMSDGTVTHKIRKSNVYYNQANYRGGGLFIGCKNAINTENLTSVRCGTKNSSSTWLSEKSKCQQDVLLVDAVDFSLNLALYGGGIATYSTSHIKGAYFVGKRASIGGAAFLSDTECSLTEVDFKENTGCFGGNALYAERSMLRTEGCFITHVTNNNHSDTNILLQHFPTND